MPSDHDLRADQEASGVPVNVRRAKLVMFFAILALGVATIVVTITNGGNAGSKGILFGGVLCALALMRIFISIRYDS